MLTSHYLVINNLLSILKNYIVSEEPTLVFAIFDRLLHIFIFILKDVTHFTYQKLFLNVETLNLNGFLCLGLKLNLIETLETDLINLTITSPRLTKSCDLVLE